MTAKQHVPPVSQPLVSVLTPSYNQARWLGENLHSVACQTYPRIEHVVMDGGSTDGSDAVLTAANPPVRWASEADRGQSHALNKAFAASSGEIIGWLNSDDAFWDCRVVEDVVAFFEAHPDVDVVYGHSAYVNEDGLLLHFFRVPSYGSGSLLRRYNYIIQPSVFVRRRVVGQSLVDESFHFAMDYELWLRLAAGGAKLARIDRVLAIDRAQRARKSLNLLDVLETDMRRLAVTYGVAQSKSSRMLTAAHAVWSRFAGARLVLRLPREFAFTAQVDSAWKVVWRQCFQRRRDMSVGED